MGNTGGYEMQEYVDYNTAVRHQSTVKAHNIHIPENLLKVQDLQKAY